MNGRVFPDGSCDLQFTHGLCPECAEELYPDSKPGESATSEG